ncbi:hypothetical protein CO676_08190 [Sinorhizobium sp. BJ1]|jgi:hypothetical protein|uniref:DUF4440 domain-containing protein n=2 Tax=Sinorhizobium/Ensifer group TaxID=227292 RepID=I3XAR9_SINF2|nr:hypothetical protein [Sinorhizobium sp. BJ1]AFL52975.1 hypothetical protein USDA257_c44370 [Sinorhizobium fredii USDA 257]PDT84970.1 hypothetical protein CO676_08190 [Sinorhizobium sp. BJ1]
MDDREAWELERRLWLEGAGAYQHLLDDECLMAFAPVGILVGVEIIRALDGAPRWKNVEMTEQRSARPNDSVLVLAYRAEARREPDVFYAAYCTSTYARTGEDWRLIQHQQASITPSQQEEAMDDVLRSFFARYESMANRVLARKMDVGDTTFAFASDFIAASPVGVMAGKNDESLKTSMEKGYARYRAIGTRELKIRDLKITPIDALHFLVRVDWRSVYERDKKPDVTIDFEVHYFVQLRNGEPKIFGWVSGDEEAVLREHGIG